MDDAGALQSSAEAEPTNVIKGFLHIAVKTADLEKTRRFYRRIFGFVETFRPDLGFPGAWLAPGPGQEAIIHVYAGRAAEEENGFIPSGTAAIDHVSMMASGYHSMRARLKAAGLDWREAPVPGTRFWQIFVYDPSGVQLELFFDSEVEDGPGPDPSKRYNPLERYFDPKDYAHL